MARKSLSPVTFWLRDQQANKPTPIHCLVCFNNERLKFSIPFKVLPNHWNSDKYRVKNMIDATNKDHANTFMNDLEKFIINILNELKGQRVLIDKATLKSRINSYLKPVNDLNQPKTLLDFIRHYISTCSTRLVRSKGNRTGRVVSPNTIRRYKTTLNGLEAFARNYNRSLEFSDIDVIFYKDFTEWLTAKDYATNNVSKYIENLKGFMSAAVEEGYTSNLAFRKFSNMREDVENIYLTETELQRIYNLDLSKNYRLERVRDLFIIAAWTGLRFSDFSALQQEHIKLDETGHKYFDLKQQKTSVRVQIPIIHESVLRLLIKYDNVLPTGISNQKTNDYLKEICKLAEIDSVEMKHITKGGKRVQKTSQGWSIKSPGIPKWQLVTSHTARRSFATNMFKRGMPTLLIMKLTGHRKESEFLKYIKVDAQETMSLVRTYFKNEK